jgi:hypothetical protein
MDDNDGRKKRKRISEKDGKEIIKCIISNEKLKNNDDGNNTYKKLINVYGKLKPNYTADYWLIKNADGSYRYGNKDDKYNMFEYEYTYHEYSEFRYNSKSSRLNNLNLTPLSKSLCNLIMSKDPKYIIKLLVSNGWYFFSHENDNPIICNDAFQNPVVFNNMDNIGYYMVYDTILKKFNIHKACYEENSIRTKNNVEYENDVLQGLYNCVNDGVFGDMYEVTDFDDLGTLSDYSSDGDSSDGD